MKLNILQNSGIFKVLLLGVTISFLISCNKDLPGPTPVIFPSQGTQSALEFISSDTTYSYFLAAITKASPAVAGAPTLLSMLGDSTAVYTIFAPNNDAFRVSGIPSVAVINSPAFTPGQLDTFFRYHIIPGQQWLSAGIPTAFPNIQLPSLLDVGTLPGTPVPFTLSLYPSKQGNFFWVNTIPVGIPDKILNNGVLHTPIALIQPPGKLLGWALGPGVLSDPQFSLFDSLIVRGDIGATDLTKTFNYALNQPFANLTVFAPTNTAVKEFITAASGGLIPAAAPDAVFAGFISTNLPVANAQGIVAYHILPTKAFSVNFPATAAITPTLVPPALNPGVSVQAFFTGPFVDSLKVLGLAPSNGGIPATSKPSSNFDKNAVNGVLHAIDKVLLPQ